MGAPVLLVFLLGLAVATWNAMAANVAEWRRRPGAVPLAVRVWRTIAGAALAVAAAESALNPWPMWLGCAGAFAWVGLWFDARWEVHVDR